MPQLAATGIGTNPTYFLVEVSPFKQITYNHGIRIVIVYYQLLVREGTYSPWLATDILTHSTSRTLPLNWTSPYEVYQSVSTCTATAIASAVDGSAIVAGVTCGGSSVVFYTTMANVLSSWTQRATITGNHLRLALDPSGYAVATTTSSGSLSATWIPLLGGTPVTQSLASGVVQASPVVVRTQEGSEIGVVYTRTTGIVGFASSWEGGVANSYGFYTISSLTNTNVSGVFTSIGSTRLGAPGGSPGQLSASVVGNTIVALYTVLQHGTAVGAVSISSDDGLIWGAPETFPLVAGSLSDPQIVGTQGGDIYATWLASAGGNRTAIEVAAFGADGLLIQSPAPIPNGTGQWNLSSPEVVGVAIDSFQRPLLVWTTAGNVSCNAMLETGAYLSPSAIKSVLSHGLWNLTTSDFQAGGSVSTFANGVLATTGVAVTDAGRASTSTYLNAARNETAYSYQNVSVNSVAYFGELIKGTGGNKLYTMYGGASLTAAVKVGPGIAPDPNGTLVQSTGFGSAATYLTMYDDWLLAAEGVVPTAPANPAANATLLGSPEVLASYGDPGVATTTVDGNLSTATVTPTVVNPTTLEFGISGSFAAYAYTINSGSHTTCNGHQQYSQVDVFADTPAILNTTPSINNLNPPMISKSTGTLYPYYVQNVSADTLIIWGVTLAASYIEFDNRTAWAGCTKGSTTEYFLGHSPTHGPESASMTTGAELSTTLTTSITLTETGGSLVTLHWVNSMVADGKAGLSPGGFSSPLSGFVGTTSYSQGMSLTPGTQYSAFVNTSSHPGGWNAAWTPSVSVGLQTSSPVQATTSTCTFVDPATTLRLWGLQPASGLNDTAAISWWASGYGLGVVEYHEYATATNQTVIAASQGNIHNQSVQYTAEVHGIQGGAIYGILATTTISAGPCLSLASNLTAAALLGQGFALSPQAYSYDSVTAEGGGEGVFASMAPGLLLMQQNGLATISTGYLLYGSANGSGPNVTMSIPSLSGIACAGNCYLKNITPSAANATYEVQEFWNVTWSGHTTLTASAAVTFRYLQDSSGDGLTDAEKLAGWTVTYTDVHGLIHNQLVTAAPSLYSTNGLVGDYVEKDYGLNPNTVDSAGSHMLDTWNLTFNLGSTYPLTIPGNVAVWNETGTYNPFSTTVQYSPGLNESGKPVGSSPNVTSYAPSPAGGPTSGDGSPAAATKLYTAAAAVQLGNLIQSENVGWVRGILGTYDNYHTLTVWGKLSWGSDPLVASSPTDGIADGARVNPLYTEGLDISYLNAAAFNLQTGAGYAVGLYPTNISTGGMEYLNYSSQAIVGNATIPTVYQYFTVLPVVQTVQEIALGIDVVYRTQGGNLVALPINGSSWQVYFDYDLVGGRHVYDFDVSGTNGSSGAKAYVYFDLQAVAMGEKAPTYLWLPTANSTVNGLPVGLKRYTGEQSFDLVVVNASSTWSSDSVVLPWGGGYTVTVQPGLNNFLIPREQLLASPFGEALLEGKAPAYNRSDPTPPLVGLSGVVSLISPFAGANPYVNLSAYWQNRAINAGSTGNFSNEGGTAATNSMSVQVVAVPNPPSNNTGGLPSNPSLLNTSNANAPTAAVQAIITLNVTSMSTLDALLAGLLDNSSNGVNGSFSSVTFQVPFLGLDPAVTSALVNSALLSDGLCAGPTSSYPRRRPPLAECSVTLSMP